MVTAALPPAPILIYAREFTFNGSRNLGPSGLWRINFENLGEDQHDIWVLRRSTKRVVGHSGIFLPGQHGAITVRLRPGTYTLYCGVANHRALGMRWRVKVVRPAIRRTAP